MRQYLNDEWIFHEQWSDKMLTYDWTEGETVRIPHTTKELPYHYFSEKLYEGVSGYRKYFNVRPEWMGKRVLLTFEAVAHIAKVSLVYKEADGKDKVEFLTEHKGGYTAFTVELTPYLTRCSEFVIVVQADSRESNNIPPFGKVIDYMTYSGIYRDVYLEVKEPTFVEDVFVETLQVNEAKKKVNAQITIDGLNHPVRVVQKLRCLLDQDPKAERIVYEGELTQSVTKVSFEISDVLVWNLKSPVLYQLETNLYEKERLIDTKVVRFGFRTCEFKQDGFYLNDEKVKLRGLNRHQSYPYVGYAMPKRPQQTDANVLKHELGLNAVRTSHYPQSHDFIDRCDEIGLLVFTEIPGWQNIGDEEWKNVAKANTKEMVLQYRNHPSIILWGVRINESLDDDELYKETNEIAHELDSSRCTGGVRYIKKSHLLEDVYTFNDFSHNGKTKGAEKKKAVTSNDKAAYLVSEYNGHMFPTKSFDHEEHRLEHAMRHANVLEELYAQDDIAGGFGWCMFDYNTHQEFGSGDRICYHGVMDMFRNPKLAAYVYQSQSEETDVCAISSTMDIGEHPACYIGPVIAFTNADSIRVYKNEEFVKEFYPDLKKYGHMPHPPIIMDDFVGELLEKKEKVSKKHAEMMKEVLFAIAKNGQDNLSLRHKLKMVYVMVREKLNFQDGVRMYGDYVGNWGGTATTYRFEAIKNGKVVKVIHKRPQTKVSYAVTSDTTVLQESKSYDVATIRIHAVGENGELLPYYQETATIELTGPIELIGPDHISLKGGAAGTYIKTTGTTGVATVTVKGNGIDPVTVSLVVE